MTTSRKSRLTTGTADAKLSLWLRPFAPVKSVRLSLYQGRERRDPVLGGKIPNPES